MACRPLTPPPLAPGGPRRTPLCYAPEQGPAYYRDARSRCCYRRSLSRGCARPGPARPRPAPSPLRCPGPSAEISPCERRTGENSPAVAPSKVGPGSGGRIPGDSSGISEIWRDQWQRACTASGQLRAGASARSHGDALAAAWCGSGPADPSRPGGLAEEKNRRRANDDRRAAFSAASIPSHSMHIRGRFCRVFLRGAPGRSKIKRCPSGIVISEGRGRSAPSRFGR